MIRDLYLCIDVGTGSVRSALVDAQGHILFIASREHEQIVPAYGWSEQRPADWWTGVAHTIRQIFDTHGDARARIVAVCACGQMHGTVLIGADGNPTRETAPLWNDKRTSGLAAAFDRTHRPETYLGETGNPPTPAWPAFKLQWLRDNDAAAWRKAEMVLMPKDFVNFRLTGIAATDWTEASCTFLMNPSRRSWSRAMIEKLGLDAAKMPPIRSPGDILGPVTPAAARETGLAEGTPVLVGGSDFPMALLGSGACRPGLASEVMGSSNIITSIMDRPLLRADISNVATIEGHWGAFALLDSGGDAMRWARRAFHEKKIDYEEIVARAAEAPAGAGMLFFLPYLVGERFGQHRNSRAQFFGLTAGHGLAHLHRAVMEGVAFAVAQQIRIMEAASGNTVERVIASGGGAKTALWLRIKASVYGIPIIVPREAECGITGCAALAATATGRFARLDEAIAALVGFENEVMPDPEWQAIYQKMLPVFEKLYRNAQQFYDDLDRLSD